jgi:hypothetical protein
MALAVGKPACVARLAALGSTISPIRIYRDTYAEGLDPEEVPADVQARRIPSSWIDGVARLDHPPSTNRRRPDVTADDTRLGFAFALAEATLGTP